MIPRFRPPYKILDLQVLLEINNFKKVKNKFEIAFAKKANQGYARVFPYGRTALVAVLEYLKENAPPHKTQVICPSYTCIVVAHAIVEAGLDPVFIDIENESLNMDWNFVNQAVSEKTLSVISTSLFGNPVQKSILASFRGEHPNIPIIQDCAHSFFADQINREGFAAIYGMNVSKIITTIYGGMVSTDDVKLAKWLEHYQSRKLIAPTFTDRLRRSFYLFGALIAFSKLVYWFVFYLQNRGFLDRFVNYYNPNLIDFPIDAYKQIGVIECALGLRQLKNYDKEILRRQKLAKTYKQFASSHIIFSNIKYEPNSTYSHFVLKSSWAENLILLLRKRGIELGQIVDYDVSSLPAYRWAPYFGQGHSRKAPKVVVNLPIHHGVSERVAKKILKDLDVVSTKFKN